MVFFFFFFSSRRRHTRSDRDWSSDVCSSDLVELFEFADLVAGLALGVAPGIVARAQLDIAEAGIADDQAGDLADGAGDGDDGFLLAAAAGDAPVAFAQEGVGVGGRHDGRAERAAQVGAALAGAAVLGGGAGLDGAAGQPGPCGGVPGGGELGHAGAQFGDDDLGVGGADAGDLIEPLDDRQHPGLVAGAGGGVAAADQPAAGADSS